MRHLVCLAFFTAFSLLAAPSHAQAQVLHLYGKVHRHGPQFTLENTEVRLQSSTVNLWFYVHQFVGLYGENVGSATEPVIEVTAIYITRDWLELKGEAELGGKVELDLYSDNGNFFVFFFATEPGFLPLEYYFPGVSGTLFLGLNTAVVFALGEFAEEVEYEIPIPLDPNLIDLEFWIQAAIVTSPLDASYITATYLNVVSDTIED